MVLVKLDRPLMQEYIRDRLLKRNKNFLGCFVGSTGSGKSYSALRLAEDIDPTFSIENVAFKAKDFASLVQRDWPAGSCLVWDETGIELSSRAWQSLSNRMIHLILQSFRFKNLAVLFTLPDFSFLDVGARKLLHGLFVTKKIDPVMSQVVCQPLLLQVDPRSGKTYFKYLRVELGGQLVPIKRLRLGKPSFELMRAYEVKRKAFAQSLFEGIAADLAKAAPKEPKPLTERQQEFYDLLKQGLSMKQAVTKLGLAVQTGYDMLGAVKRKGWKF